MNQSTPKIKTTNTQSVRLPMDLYEKIAELALQEDTSMTVAIIRLIKLGLGSQANFERAVRDFVFREISKKELEELSHGKAPVVHT